MTRIRFHQELDELKHRILAMAGMAEQAVDLAVQAYSQRDLALCERVLTNEPGINRAEREVDGWAIGAWKMESDDAWGVELGKIAQPQGGDSTQRKGGADENETNESEDE